MYTEKITNRQLFFLFFIQRTTVVISFLPALTSADALQDAWLASLFSLLPSTALIFIIGKLAIKFPDKSIVQYSQELVGPLLGKFLSLFYLYLFLYIAATDLRLYGEVLKLGFMPETPLVVIAGIMTLAVVYAVYAGLEPLSRCADVIFPIFMLMILGTLLIPLTHVDFQNLQPVFSRGWMPVFRGSIIPVMIADQYVNLTIIVPAVDEPQKTLRTALWSLALSTFFLVLFTVMVVAVLGAEEGARATFPVFKMIRETRISVFLERVEPLTIFAWGLGLFITNSVNLYSGSKGLSQLLGAKDNRFLILPMAVIWVVFSFLQYRDFLEIRQFLRPQTGAPFIFFMILFPVSVLWVAYLFKRRK